METITEHILIYTPSSWRLIEGLVPLLIPLDIDTMIYCQKANEL